MNDKNEVFEIDDLILPMLRLPDPCPVQITIYAEKVFLQIGPRDWEWDRATGKLNGCGTGLC